MAAADVDLLKHATPEELTMYEQALREINADKSPLDCAVVLFPETRRWAHLEYLNEHLLALAEYRLYATGPGPSPRWFYETGDGTRQPAATPRDIPENVTTFYGLHPEDVDDGTAQPARRVLFRLAISMMPRAGKSRLVTETFPIWCQQRDPHVSVAIGTYSDDFAAEWGAKTRDLLVDLREEGDEFLPGIRGGRRSAAAYIQFEGSRTGHFRFVGVGGGITGKGYQVMVGDDFIKNAVEAASEANRKGARDFYDTTWITRKTRDYRPDSVFPIPIEVLMNTRWNEADVQGHACYNEDGTTSAEWFILNLPALALEDDPLGREPGEALVPAVKTELELLELRAKSPVWFSSLYQGSPAPEEGGIIPMTFTTYDIVSDDVVTFKTLPDENGDRSTATVPIDELIAFSTADMAATKKTRSDWTVLSHWWWSREHEQLFLRSMYRGKITTDEYMQVLVPFIEDHGDAYTAVENVTYGQAFMQSLRKRRMPAREMPAKQDKVARLLASLAPEIIRRGGLALPAKPPEGTDLHEFREELRVFPNGRHDDIVDTVSFAGEVVRELPKYRRPPAKKAQTRAEEIDAAVDTQTARDARRRQKGRSRGDIWSRMSR